MAKHFGHIVPSLGTPFGDKPAPHVGPSARAACEGQDWSAARVAPRGRTAAPLQEQQQQQRRAVEMAHPAGGPLGSPGGWSPPALPHSHRQKPGEVKSCRKRGKPQGPSRASAVGRIQPGPALTLPFSASGKAKPQRFSSKNIVFRPPRQKQKPPRPRGRFRWSLASLGASDGRQPGRGVGESGIEYFYLNSFPQNKLDT